MLPSPKAFWYKSNQTPWTPACASRATFSDAIFAWYLVFRALLRITCKAVRNLFVVTEIRMIETQPVKF